MKHALNAMLLGLLILSVAGCSDDNPTAPGDGQEDSGIVARFEGDFAADRWSSEGITDGTTTITPETGAADSLVFAYDVQLSGGGVSARTTAFTMVAPADGIVTLDWHYHGFHAWYQATVEGLLWAETPAGTAAIPLVEQSVGGIFEFSGEAAITVYEGLEYGFEVGGSNYDSNSRLRGDLTVHGFRFVPADPPAGD